MTPRQMFAGACVLAFAIVVSAALQHIFPGMP